MVVGGYPVKAITEGTFDGGEAWFDTAAATYNAVFDSSGKAGFVVNNLFGFKVGQTINLTGTYGGTAIIKSIQDSSNKILFTDKNFTTDGSGTITVDGSIEWDVDTPEDILREVHIQISLFNNFLSESPVKIEVSPDDESTWFSFNNGVPIIGLHTFTLFVLKDTQLNFRSVIGSESITVTVHVTAS